MILNPAQRPVWSRYVIAVLAVVLGAAVREWALGTLGTRAPFLTFYPAVILAALFGGLPAGLLATGLSAAVAAYAWMGPPGRFSFHDPADWLMTGFFVLSCSAISLVAQAMQRAQARAADAEAEATLAAERSRTADDLRRYKLLAEHSRDVVLFVRRDDGRILEANDAAARVYGYDRAELQSMSVHQLRSSSPREVTDRQLAAADEGGVLFEAVHCRKDGSCFPVEVSSQGATVGGVRMLLSVVRDISERRRAEEVLRESERQLVESQRVAGLGSYVLDIPAGIWKSSAVMDEVFGIGESYVRSVEGWVALVHPEWRQQMADYFANEVLIQKARFDKEYKIVRHNDGAERWVHGIGELELDADGRPIRMLGTILDITGRKQAEEEKAKLEGQFHQAQKMESVGRLAGGVAHDFNNLLTVINGYSQLLLRDLAAGDPLRSGLEEISSAGERAAGLTRQLLAFSRKQVLHASTLDLNRVVRDTRPMLERLLGEDIELQVELRAGAATICADQHQLEQVLLNLAVNSRDAMPDGGKLLIETAAVQLGEERVRSRPDARPGPYVLLAVSDTGVGMSEETRNRVFEPFFTTKGIGQGTGLGLSMVQGIVAQSGGHIEVYSEKGIGTTFRIYLPATTGALTGAETPGGAPRGGTETVLVVEDQAEVRRYAAAVLKEYGYRVIPVENPAEAPRLCEGEHVDLVLTDVVMPQLSGRELADRLKLLRPTVRIVFMSGYTDSVIERHGILEEGVEFIQKPFSPEDLARKVRAVLDRPCPPAS